MRIFKSLVILSIFAFLIIICLPYSIRPIKTLNLGKFKRTLEVKQGLDLQGGTEIILELDMSQIDSSDKDLSLESAEAVIRRRVDLFGVSEPLIQRSIYEDQHRLIVQLAGIDNLDQALNLIGQTAQLDFREIKNPPELEDLPLQEEGTDSAQIRLSDFSPTGLTGSDLKKAYVSFDSQGGGGTQVVLEFTDQGREQFAQITRNNINKPVAIFLDAFPVTIPTVQQEITDGQAVITGDFTPQAAKQLAIQLNAGALPAPINITAQRTVGPTLGQDSITKSLKAGAIGLGLVMMFMIAFYGRLGIIANLGLLVYGLITLSIYKLVPVTLTLPGLAGFILSVGMAVDANILIFERYKEELRLKKPWAHALELGFGRAWDSIKDANIATLTTAFILFNPLDWQFLPQSGMVRGFALTLSIGVLTSLFTGIVVTRFLLKKLYKGGKHA